MRLPALALACVLLGGVLSGCGSKPPCDPSCQNAECGDDGCGGLCGTCDSGYRCNGSRRCVSDCTPSCSGKACGDDGCGGSCGSCGDGNTCTTDTCSAGACMHQPVADSIECSELFLRGCEAGAPVAIDCRTVCADAGYNAVLSCGYPGANPTVCNCTNVSEACSSSKPFCNTQGHQVSCDPATDFWTATDCESHCKALGWEGSQGCRSVVGFCACRGTVTYNGTNYACSAIGGICGNDTNPRFCCTGACTWYYNGGNDFFACSPPTTCEPRCMEGSVCCGGAFCAGNCIGNPCC